MRNDQSDLVANEDVFRRAMNADHTGVPYCRTPGRNYGGERSHRMNRRRDQLTALCRELQRDAADQQFTLKLRTVECFLDIGTTQAWLLIRNLVYARIIENVSPRLLKRSGSKFRYLHEV